MKYSDTKYNIKSYQVLDTKYRNLLKNSLKTWSAANFLIPSASFSTAIASELWRNLKHRSTWSYITYVYIHYTYHIISQYRDNLPRLTQMAYLGANTEETSEHFLWECVAYMAIRFRTFGKANITTITDIATSSPSPILKYNKLTERF